MRAFRAVRNVRPRFSRGVSQVLEDPTAWNQAPVMISTLSNGVRVASRENMGETSTVGIFLDAGIRSETPETAGATNLLEQLSYMGTAKRPQQKFEQEIESLGGALNVSMGREQCAFTMTTGKSDAKQA
eukprot:1862016-Amphidinium_carterae.1